MTDSIDKHDSPLPLKMCKTCCYSWSSSTVGMSRFCMVRVHADTIPAGCLTHEGPVACTHHRTTPP